MEPLSPNDPLWKLLGQAKPVKPRPNFTQNVLRAARQTPQEKGWLFHLKAWFGTPTQIALRGALAAAAVIAMALLIERPWQPAQHPGLAQIQNKAGAPVTTEVTALDAEFPTTPEVSTQWENMEKFDALLAVEDTSQLTDREINFLLY
jgi:hypothetical protein